MLENRWTEGHVKTSANKIMLAAVGLSCIILVAAPSGFDTFKCIIFQQSGPVREMVSEYASPWSLWPATMYYWIFIGVALASLPGLLGRTYLKQGALVCVLALISVAGYRYIPFFVLVAAPYMAASLSRMSKNLKIPEGAAQVSVLLIALAYLGYGFKQDKVFQHGLQEQRFPVGAVSYIKAHRLSGKMFNSMNWGGYLLWNLYGTTTLFIDGRTLDPYRVAPYTNMLWATRDGLRYFEQANFELVLMSPGNAFTGERYPLIAYLQNQPGWQLVYQDGSGYLFAKRVQ